ncbi:MAG: T9SS type A sorting domain-containing protein [Ignavibacteria bacterium]
MSKLILVLLVTFFCMFKSASSFAVEPTFDMSIRNITTYPDPDTGADSLLTFDVYLQWTNPGVSDPFEYVASEGVIYVNHSVFNGGVVYGIGQLKSFSRFLPFTSDLPGYLQTQHTQCIAADPDRDLLYYAANDDNSAANFFVSSIFPGTRIMKFRLRTSAHIWAFVNPEFKFKLTAPNKTSVWYWTPSTDPKEPDHQLAIPLSDTINNHYTTETNPVLPIELSSFNSTVNANGVTLYWSTVSESNNAGFDIERRSTGSNDWTKTGYVNGSGTISETHSYSFSERLNSGKYNYRLKQIDFNGSFEYFNLSNEVEVGVPSVYSISQNYPNPFNPSTNIDFQLPYDSKVSILLYDVSGRQVGNLLNETKTSGYYTIKFDGSALSSGIYFYTINAEGAGKNNFISTKRMMLLK